MIYTTIKTYELIENWQNIALLNLIFFSIRPYVHPATYNWNFFNTLEQTLNNTYNQTEVFPEVECKFDFKKNSDLIYIESWIGGEIEGLYGEQFDADINFTADFSFGNNFQIAYLNTSGLVQGMGYRGWVQGIINNIPVKVSIEYQYTLLGYSMPEYRFGEYCNFLTNNELALVIAIPSSVVLLSASILLGFHLRKKKISKKPDN